MCSRRAMELMDVTPDAQMANLFLCPNGACVQLQAKPCCNCQIAPTTRQSQDQHQLLIQALPYCHVATRFHTPDCWLRTECPGSAVWDDDVMVNCAALEAASFHFKCSSCRLCGYWQRQRRHSQIIIMSRFRSPNMLTISLLRLPGRCEKRGCIGEPWWGSYQ